MRLDNCFEATMVRHCAATLAGHKCGSLFSWKRGEAEEMERAAERLNAALNGRGVYLKIMKKCPMGGLVYVYRAEALERRLEDPEIRRFLSQYGYEEWNEGACLDCLKRHICDQPSFPHEVGIFLDYPLEDVVGFIRYGGRAYCCQGCWKAYGHAEEAQKRFSLYQKCARIYRDCYDRGFDVARLTVSSTGRNPIKRLA
jgi:hypothetical protein